MISRIKLLSILLAMTYCISCSSSVVYSPYQNLPSRPLIKDETQVHAACGMLPETRPEKAGKIISFGGELAIRHGFTDVTTLQIKGFTDFSGGYKEDHQPRIGVGASGIFTLKNNTSNMRFAIIPAVEFLFSGNWYSGMGAAILCGCWFPALGTFNSYAVAGPLIGIKDMEDREWGYGFILNLGTAIELVEYIDLNIEAAAVMQRNEYDKTTHFIVAPCIGLGYKF